jgi:predicted ATP-binding protein involved in virulence
MSTDVSEKYTTSIFRVEEQEKQETSKKQAAFPLLAYYPSLRKEVNLQAQHSV